MKKLGAMILVLALALAMFPMTALAASSTYIADSGNVPTIGEVHTAGTGNLANPDMGDTLTITLTGANLNSAATFSNGDTNSFDAAAGGGPGNFGVYSAALRQTRTDNAYYGRFTLPSLDMAKIMNVLNSYNTTDASLTIVQTNNSLNDLYAGAPDIAGNVKTKSYAWDPDNAGGPTGGYPDSQLAFILPDLSAATTVTFEFKGDVSGPLLTIVITNQVTFAKIVPEIRFTPSSFARANNGVVGAAPTATITYTERLHNSTVPNTTVLDANNWSWAYTAPYGAVAGHLHSVGFAGLLTYMNTVPVSDIDLTIPWTVSPSVLAATHFAAQSGSIPLRVGNPYYGGYYGSTSTGPSLTYVGNGMFTSTGFYNQFQSFSANGVTLTRGTDYTIENVGGNTRIILSNSCMNSLSGSVKFSAVFTGGTASATVNLTNTYIPDDIILDPPKTGDANSLLGVGIVFIALALAAAVRKVRAGAK